MTNEHDQNNTKNPMKKIFSFWEEVSIKFKLTTIVAIFSICALMLVSFTFYRIDVTERRAQRQSERYFSLNNFITQIASSEEIFEAYVENPAQNKSAVGKDADALNDLLETFSEQSWSVQAVGQEQHALARATKNALINYIEIRNEVTKLLIGSKRDEAIAIYNDKLVSAHQYLDEYSSALLLQVLSDGQYYHDVQQKSLRIQYNCAIIVICVILFGMAVGIYQLFKGITLPVIAISKAATDFASGKFDVPDIEVKHKDEVYQLAQAFNDMKGSTKIYIQTIHEKNEMESLLQQKKLEAAETEKLLQEAKMQQLRNQINPHFLFNTLNTIARTARVEKAERSETLILSLSRLFRYGLKTDDVEVPIKREMNIINDYITIQQTRFGSRVGLVWRISENVNIDEEMLPPFTLQPLVENAIIHGLEKKIEGGTVRIRIHFHNDNLYILVSDNGVGISKEALEKIMQKKENTKGHVSGIGLSNVAERLKMLYGGCEVTTHSKQGLGTCVTIKIPRKNKHS